MPLAVAPADWNAWLDPAHQDAALRGMSGRDVL
ncbi:SOS response-associated peptidase [Streptomyces sp. ISID311]|nr:SOS response-associated peptidase [Streptomyces sp. ISID311]